MSQTTTPKPKLVHNYSTVIGQRSDPYQRQSRVRIEVDVIPRNQMIGEANVPQGPALVDIPASMLEVIQALVINTDNEAMAIKRLERLEEEWAAKNPEGSRSLSPHSVSSAYRSMFGHDMGALRYCKVIEENLPAPLTVEEERAANVATSMTRQSRGKSR